MTTNNLVFLLTGTGLFFWGLWLWRQRQRLVRHGQFTTGMVIGHDEGPIVRFYTQDQKPVSGKSAASPSSRYHPDGASIGVYYDPEKPRDFVLDTTEHKVTPLLIMLMGIVFFLGGLFSKID
ncbi:DUF3592 domain-containing protein [Hymenobacter lucidus]|uniref:DUF3592 domain-containing protein n=1 Tax=Hymenobacter lucidus TaxID=2880930 RepID=A0ABS8ARH1_9BACT|nr:DUF3592 domain-containing protein [Hymenobacter lucidus]MCB2408822.1 DUF3592 domain-containing protein [Hymenobacter lucidus]